MQRQQSSQDTATRDATTEPRHPLNTTVTTHKQSLMGFLVSPSPTDKVCDVPHRRALGPNGITSHANLFTDTPACYHRCHKILTDHQTALSTVAPTVASKDWPPFDAARQGLRRFARELSSSVGLTARTSGASLLWSCVTTKCCGCCARWQVTPHTMAT